jgi:hypothetical protein
MYFGWISCDKSRKAELQSLGIKLGRYDSTRFINCWIPDEAYEELESLTADMKVLFLVDYIQEAETLC